MYIFHLCAKSKVSFNEIKMVAKYYGLHPDLRASTEITNQEFLELINHQREPEFQCFYQEYRQGVDKKAKEDRKIFKLQEQEKKAANHNNEKGDRVSKSDYIDNNGDLDYYDEEEEIMKALENGNGDRFGF